MFIKKNLRLCRRLMTSRPISLSCQCVCGISITVRRLQALNSKNIFRIYYNLKPQISISNLIGLVWFWYFLVKVRLHSATCKMHTCMKESSIISMIHSSQIDSKFSRVKLKNHRVFRSICPDLSCNFILWSHFIRADSAWMTRVHRWENSVAPIWANIWRYFIYKKCHRVDTVWSHKIPISNYYN